jgi:hypothetical protein
VIPQKACLPHFSEILLINKEIGKLFEESLGINIS